MLRSKPYYLIYKIPIKIQFYHSCSSQKKLQIHKRQTLAKKKKGLLEKVGKIK